MTSNLALVVIIAHLFVLALLVVGWQSLSKLSHKILNLHNPSSFHIRHAGQQGIDCNYCHSSARKGKHSNIPSTNVCERHANIVEGPKHGTKEIAKIYKAVGYDVDSDLILKAMNNNQSNGLEYITYLIMHILIILNTWLLKH